MRPVLVNGKQVGPGQRPYIIAEAAVNHGGDAAVAETMIHMARAMGADAIKFQMHVLENEMLRDAPRSENFDEPLYETLKKTDLGLEEHRRLKALCEQVGIDYICTPFSRAAADLLDEMGVRVFKVGSGELTNLPLQEHIARKGKPMIVSTGMSTVDEVAETVELIKGIGTPLVLTHCVSIYPTPYDRVNLGMIPTYRERFDIPVGLSDHSRGIYTALGAVAVGACLVEKHFTLDKMQKGPDHPSSIEPDELGELVKGADAVFRAMGSERRIFPEEEEIVAWARESVVSEVRIPKGTRISGEMVWVKRPAPGPGCIPAKDLKRVIGKVAAVDIPPDAQVRWDQLT
jgi:N-acetylneuraminate synthase